MRSTSKFRAWLDDRMGLSTLVEFNKSQALKPVPARMSWAYTLGTLALFFFFLQFVSGFLLLVRYSPHPDVAFQTVQTIQHKANYGWLIRQMHSWGASFIVFVLILHMLKVLWYGSYKRPREFTWFVGVLLLLVTLGFSLTGYILPWNQVAKWATAVVTGGISKTPVIGDQLYEVIVGGRNVSGDTVGRFFAVHVFLLPVLLGMLVLAHLVLIRWKGVTPKLRVDEEAELGYEGALEKVGGEPFFPRQVYKELLVMIIGFALLVTFATFFPWELGEPASKETPFGVKPEWYFLPVYQVIKYFDEDLISKIPLLSEMGLDPEFIGISLVNLFVVILLLLPVLDFGKERKITRRPFFAILALIAILAVLTLGVLGELSNNTYHWFGKKITFDHRAAWTVEDLPAVIPEEKGAENDDTSTQEEETDNEAPTPTPSPAWVAPDLSEATRADDLPIGGGCASSECHSSPHRSWLGSIHAANGVECVKCHGGNDAEPEDTDDEDAWFELAHEGMITDEEGEPRTPDSDEEIIKICGDCHVAVRDVFAAEHTEGTSTKDCHSCHDNHKVVPAGLHTFAEGYTDPQDPRTAKFTSIEAAMKEWLESTRPALVADVQRTIDQLAEHEYPVEELEKQLEEVVKTPSDAEKAISVMTHSLEIPKVQEAIAKARDEFAFELRKQASDTLHEIENRWRVVVGVWAVTLVFALLLVLKLRGFSRADRAAAITPLTAPPTSGADDFVEIGTVVDTPLDVGALPDAPFDEEETLVDRPMEDLGLAAESESESEAESEPEWEPKSDTEAESVAEPEDADPDEEDSEEERRQDSPF